ncbi:MerR family transcriptional regulator [bacterium]|nr:MerR family transcriptional regulator [candidate division CSSED10-310 bacterium]
MADRQSEGKYRISAIAVMLGIHPQTIRTYERMGFIHPARSRGNNRLFSDRDVEIIERIQSLTQDMGVNLAGVEIIMRMRNQIEVMQTEIHQLLDAVKAGLEGIDEDKYQYIAAVIKRCRYLEGTKRSGDDPVKELNDES